MISGSFCLGWRTKNCSNMLVLKETLKLKMIGLIVICVVGLKTEFKACGCSSLSFILIIHFGIKLLVYLVLYFLDKYRQF